MAPTVIPSEVCPSNLYEGKSWEERKAIVREYESLRKRYLAVQTPAPMNRHAKRAAAAQARSKRKRKAPATPVFVTHDGQTIPAQITNAPNENT